MQMHSDTTPQATAQAAQTSQAVRWGIRLRSGYWLGRDGTSTPHARLAFGFSDQQHAQRLAGQVGGKAEVIA